MLIVKSDSPINLYKKTFLQVYNLDILKSDPENYKDTSATLSLMDYSQDNGVGLNNKGFYSSFDYDKYIKNGNEQMSTEINHYNEEFVKSGKLESLFRFFSGNYATRRGLINLWDNDHLDPNSPFPCLVYAWFRKRGEVLDMNCHMRANNAYKILLMDLHVGTSLHEYVSKQLKLKKGTYNHIVDTLHFYKRDKKEIDLLYKKLNIS